MKKNPYFCRIYFAKRGYTRDLDRQYILKAGRGFGDYKFSIFDQFCKPRRVGHVVRPDNNKGGGDKRRRQRRRRR